MMNISVPGNVMRFMNKSLPIAKLDIFKYFWNEISDYSSFDFPTHEKLKDEIQD